MIGERFHQKLWIKLSPACRKRPSTRSDFTYYLPHWREVFPTPFVRAQGRISPINCHAREKFVLPPKNLGNVAAFPKFLCPPRPLGLNFSLALVPDFASRPCTLSAYLSVLVPAEMFTCVVPASVEPRFYPIRLGRRKNRAKLCSFARFFGREEKPRLRAENGRRKNLAPHTRANEYR